MRSIARACAVLATFATHNARAADAAECAAPRADEAPDSQAAIRRAFLDRFATSLAKERDYYRAIGVWKELRFDSASREDRVRYSLSIAQSYRLSFKFLSALAASAVVQQDRCAKPEQRATSLLVAGESYVGLKLPTQARAPLRASILATTDERLRARAHLLLGVAEADSSSFDTASTHFRESARLATNETDRRAAEGLSKAADKAEDMPHRSPFLAAALSTVVPGAGQAYSGHIVDALQAFFFVGAFGLSSFAAYKYDHSRGGPYVLTATMLSITGIFHIANIFGAERTARYYNQRARDVYVGSMRDMALTLPPP